MISSDAEVVGADGSITDSELEDVDEVTEGTEITITEDVVVVDELSDGSLEVSISDSSPFTFSFVKLSVMTSDTFSSLGKFWAAESVGERVVVPTGMSSELLVSLL